jgi:hypothetical protein
MGGSEPAAAHNLNCSWGGGRRPDPSATTASPPPTIDMSRMRICRAADGSLPAARPRPHLPRRGR